MSPRLSSLLLLDFVLPCEHYVDDAAQADLNVMPVHGWTGITVL
jgi:hypothetical protein